jgi:predicted ATPase
MPDAESYKHQLYQLILDLFLEWSEKKPLLMVLDDLQWADPASLALLQHILQLILQKPILIIFAMRDDRQSQSWQLKSDLEDQFPEYFSELYLEPLTEEQGKGMVENLLCTTGTPYELCDYVLEKAEGNPFYLEEIVRSLIDSGVIAKINPEDPRSEYNWQDGYSIDDIHIPDNVYALLAARIDRLSNGSRRLLQLASVIGRTFPYQLLQQIYDSSEMMDEYLSELQNAEMIQEIGVEPEKEFIFRHALTQETAYRSILRSQRREYHLKVGEVLELSSKDQIENVSSILAFHFEKANDERRTVEYNLIAGETALHLYALPQALDHFSRAVEVISNQEYPTEFYTPERISKVYKRRGRAFELSSNFKHALANYEELEKLARKCKPEKVLLTALISQTLLYCTATELFNEKLGEKLLAQSMDLAIKLNDRQAEAKILWLELNLSRLIGDQRRARYAGEKSLQIVRELNLKEQLPYTLHDLAYAYSGLDMIDKSIETFQEAGLAWQELNNLPMLADSISGNVLNLYAKGDSQGAIKASEKAYQISKSIKNLWGQSFSRIEVGLVYRDLGQPSKALEMMKSSVRLGNEAGFYIPSVYVSSQISFVYGDLGLYGKGLECAEKALNISGTPFINRIWKVSWISLMEHLYIFNYFKNRVN